MRRDLIALLSLILSAGCGDSGGSTCAATLTPGATDQTAFQAAFIAAKTNDVICIEAGTFTFTDELSLALSPTVNHVTIRGATRATTILDFSGQATGGNAIKVTSSDANVGDFIIEKLTIKDPTGDGIRTENITNVTFRDVRVYWSGGALGTNGAYGVYPVMSTNVLVENVEVSGAADAAIYVGQSRNAVVRNSVAFDSQTGIEIENTTDAEVHGNTVHDNVTGLLVFNLPNLPRKDGSNANVHDNMVLNNNTPSFALSGIVQYVPQGTGILVLAADNFEVHNNTVMGNESTGIAVISCTAINIAAPAVVDCSDPLYNGYPQQGNIHDNTFTVNGEDPHGFFGDLGITPFPTVFFDGFVEVGHPDELCIRNGTVTFTNFTNSGDTLAMHDCTHPALPSITVTWGTSP